MRRETEEVCGTCKYNRVCLDGKYESEYCCHNVDGEYYGLPIEYNDWCIDWEKRMNSNLEKE